MKKLLVIFAAFAAFSVLVSCGSGLKSIASGSGEAANDEDSADTADTGDTGPTDTGDTGPTDTGDTQPTDTGNTGPTDTGDTGPTDTGDTGPTDTGNTGPADTGDSEPTDTGDTGPTDTGDTGPADTGDSEPTDTGDDGDTQPVEKNASCSGLPENAEWNPASVITQTCISDNCEPSSIGYYNEDPADSVTAVSAPDPVDPTMQPCPDGQAPQDGKCVTCGIYISRASVEESDAGTKILDPNKCFTDYKYNSQGNIVWNSLSHVCCCGDSENPLYTVKNNEIAALTPPYSLADGEMVCTVPGCNEGFVHEETTGKCYECLGELSLNEDNYQCETEIASECRFKCKDGFAWNGFSCFEN